MKILCCLLYVLAAFCISLMIVRFPVVETSWKGTYKGEAVFQQSSNEYIVFFDYTPKHGPFYSYETQEPIYTLIVPFLVVGFVSLGLAVWLSVRIAKGASLEELDIAGSHHRKRRRPMILLKWFLLWLGALFVYVICALLPEPYLTIATLLFLTGSVCMVIACFAENRRFERNLR